MVTQEISFEFCNINENLSKEYSHLCEEFQKWNLNTEECHFQALLISQDASQVPQLKSSGLYDKDQSLRSDMEIVQSNSSVSYVV
ncbi:unnamed protein product [Moneuplotes crassus]|uniref:Uncharacterized protein n=1 Tax=Euplotes crassus TaxID=5936 RepID=A0AAD2D452_EUPCR|nr:unnamed protein product [Moneuplotes crassus]